MEEKKLIEEIKDWLIMIISGLVNEPEKINISIVNDEQGILFVIMVDKQDNGRVIGKGGSIIEALRVILRAGGQLKGIRISIKIDAPNSRFELKER